MSDDIEDMKDADSKRSFPKIPGVPSLKTIGEFLLNVLALERSVEALKAQNKALDSEIRGLERRSMIKPGSSRSL